MKNPHPNSAVAIIGMGCRLPGAKDLDQFWNLLRAGRTAWGPAPEARFNRPLYFHPEKGARNKSYSDLAALVDYGPMDRSVCPLSDAAIATHDLAHLTLCEVAAAACRHAGLDPAALPYDNTGVYVGHATASGVGTELTFATYIAETAKYLRDAVGFEQLTAGLGEQLIHEIVDAVRHAEPSFASEQQPFLGASYAARLISETFALSGPCMSFNAACASSSRALAQAVRALQLGNIDMAIVGGASFFHSDTMVLFSQSHSLTTQGSWPFTDRADGMVVGEGYATLVLKMLDRAVADNDRILAVVPSIGSSSDGHGKSLWAPRFEGQVKAIQRAYGSEVSIADLQYIEAHATSTALGDVTEIKSLTTVLAGHLPPGAKLPVGSAKLNVGHTLECAGLVGILKTVLSLQNEVIPPAVGAGALSSDIDWDAVPLYAPKAEVAWPRSTSDVPRRAGVDAFGIGGLNVHVVIDEYLPSRVARAPGARLPAPAAVRVQPRAEEDAVAIIGMGAVMPGALAREAFWELLASGRDARTEVNADRWDAEAFAGAAVPDRWATPTTRGGYVNGFSYDWRKHKIPPKQIQQASPLQFMILDAVDQAIQQANYQQRPFNREQVGVVVGTVFGGEYAAQLVMGLRLPKVQEMLADLLRSQGVAEDLIAGIAQSYGDVLMKRMPALLDETGSFTASALASRITKSFDLMGGAVAVDAGQASSFAALSCCVDQLRSGECEMMICVGSQNDMTPSLFFDWKYEGRLASGAAPSPFDLRADGVVPGEGCAALLLKRLADARRDNDPILGIIRGIGAARDKNMAAAAQLAVTRALEDSGLTPADVSLLEVSPTGDVAADAAELQGIVDAYRDRRSAEPMLLGTVVGQIGNTVGAAGMASLLKAAWEAERVEMPAVAALQQTAPHVNRHAAVLKLPRQPSAISVSNPDGRLIAGVHSGGVLEDSYHVYLERGTKLKPTNQAASINAPAVSSQQPEGENKVAHEIVHFDATTRRREKMRQHASAAKAAPPPEHKANGNGSAMSAAVPPTPIKSTPPSAPIVAKAAPAAPARPQPVAKAAPAMPAAPVKASAPPAKVLAPPVKATTPPPAAPKPPAVPSAPSHAQPAHANGAPAAAKAAAPAAGDMLNAKELEAFLVNFVVEQTGYPVEIVELDADLEADLGIDSIKKAQLFGELGEYFEVQASEDLSLDDFRTLRHVLEFLLKSQSATSPAPATPAPAATPAAAVHSNGSAVAATSAHSNGAPVAATGGGPAAVDKLDAKELEAFLVNFVVEQTGYPVEIVELDADLEADLGIDSIKKAQLFGELGEYFEVQASEDLSLDDFRTLRHVLEFLLKSQGATSAAPAAQAPATPAQSAAPAASVAAVHSNGASAAAHSNGATAAASNGAPASDKLDAKELEAFLVNFVVEQTGYPVEIVELDADLEADLGIDSIKKAQLFGELGEYFEVQASEDLSLDDFRTLRHVLEFLLKSQGAGAAIGIDRAVVRSNVDLSKAAAPAGGESH